MIVAEVIGRNYYTRRNGVAQEMPIGATVVVRGIPDSLSGKLRKVRDAKDSEFLVNDTPEAARLRDEGKEREADRVMADAKEKLAKKLDTEVAKKATAAAKKATTLPKPAAKA